MSRINWRIGALIITLTLLAGACGQKGDLYKPEPRSQSSSLIQ